MAVRTVGLGPRTGGDRCRGSGQFAQACAARPRGKAKRDGMKADATASLGVIVSGLVACAFIYFAISLADAQGIFAGSGASTAILQVAMESTKSGDAAVARAIR